MKGTFRVKRRAITWAIKRLRFPCWSFFFLYSLFCVCQNWQGIAHRVKRHVSLCDFQKKKAKNKHLTRRSRSVYDVSSMAFKKRERFCQRSPSMSRIWCSQTSLHIIFFLFCFCFFFLQTKKEKGREIHRDSHCVASKQRLHLFYVNVCEDVLQAFQVPHRYLTCTHTWKESCSVCRRRSSLFCQQIQILFVP